MSDNVEKISAILSGVISLKETLRQIRSARD